MKNSLDELRNMNKKNKDNIDRNKKQIQDNNNFKKRTNELNNAIENLYKNNIYVSSEESQYGGILEELSVGVDSVYKGLEKTEYFEI